MELRKVETRSIRDCILLRQHYINGQCRSNGLAMVKLLCRNYLRYECMCVLLFVSYVSGLFEILDRICQIFRRAGTLPVSTIRSRTAMIFLPLVHRQLHITHTCIQTQAHTHTHIHIQIHTHTAHTNMNHFPNLMCALLCFSHMRLCSVCVRVSLTADGGDAGKVPGQLQ